MKKFIKLFHKIILTQFSSFVIMKFNNKIFSENKSGRLRWAEVSQNNFSRTSPFAYRLRMDNLSLHQIHNFIFSFPLFLFIFFLGAIIFCCIFLFFLLPQPLLCYLVLKRLLVIMLKKWKLTFWCRDASVNSQTNTSLTSIYSQQSVCCIYF